MASPAVRHPGDLRWETRLLAIVTAILVVFGIAASYGAASLQQSNGRFVGETFAVKQLSGAVLGLVLLLIAARVDYRVWRRCAWGLLGLTLVLLLIPLLPFARPIAPRLNGASRWIVLGPLNFQPSEIARFVIVVWCAMLAAKKGDLVRDFRKGVAPFLVVMGVTSLLVMKEPNLSMAVVIAMLGSVVLFTSGARIGHFLLLGIGAALVIWQKLTEGGFRSARLAAFQQGYQSGITGVGYQAAQSVLGFGSGGAFGVGFGEGQQKLGYLPYAYSDFLFSAIGEEHGFLGATLVVLLYLTYGWLGLRIARTAPDPFGVYLAAGLTASVVVTAFLHMAVTIGLMPTTGLTLPFMSYGRSSLMIALLGTGVLVSIGRQRGRPQPHGQR